MADRLGLSNKIKKVNPMDEIYGLNENSEIIEKISIEKLSHYKGHKFKLYTGKRKEDMIESIKAFGVLTPIIVIPDPQSTNNYMILAGHNRYECAKEAGLSEVPARIMRGLSEKDEKEIVMITNLFQRSFSELPISEKAEIITDYYELHKERGKSITDIEDEMKKFSEMSLDDELSPVGTDRKKEVSPLGTRQVAKEYSLSKNSIARLLRINMLISGFKEKLDADEMPIRVGVDLSYLSKDFQEYIYLKILNDKLKIDMKKSEKLKMLYLNSELTINMIGNILLDKDTELNVNKNKAIKLNSSIINKYFQSNQDKEVIQNIIEKALEMYFEEKN